MVNFPECISENIVRLYINKIEKRRCEWVYAKPGDLRCGDSIIEVKCIGAKNSPPISFGNTVNWNELYVLDASDRDKNILKIYKLPAGLNCNNFKNIKMNKKETFIKQASDVRRPRASLEHLIAHLGFTKKDCLVYKGSIDELC